MAARFEDVDEGIDYAGLGELGAVVERAAFVGVLGTCLAIGGAANGGCRQRLMLAIDTRRDARDS